MCGCVRESTKNHLRSGLCAKLWTKRRVTNGGAITKERNIIANEEDILYQNPVWWFCMVAIRLRLWHRQAAHSNCLQVHSSEDETIQCVTSLNIDFVEWQSEITKKRKSIATKQLSLHERYAVSSPNVRIPNPTKLSFYSFWHEFSAKYFNFRKQLICVVCLVTHSTLCQNKRDILFLLSNNFATSRCQLHWATELTARMY